MSFKLRPEIKERWLTALRSGNYEQGQGRLVTISRTGEWSFCCLGVLCDLAVNDGVGEWGEPELLHVDGQHGVSWVYDMEHEGAVLPEGVVRWAFADSGSNPNLVVREMANPVVWLSDGSTPELAELNDDRKLSFAAIADIIEREL